MLALLLAAWLLTPEGAVPQECVPVAVSQPTPEFRLKAGDVYKGRPRFSFIITEKGKVEKLRLTKSFGIRDLDREVLRTIRKWKFKPLAGCEAVEVEGTVTIDFR